MEIVPVDNCLDLARRDSDFEIEFPDDSSSDEAEWDTDLEEYEKISPARPPVKAIYLEACEQFHVPPVRKFLMQINTDSVNLKHYGVLDNGAQAIAMTMSSDITVATLNLHDNGITSPGAICLAKMLKGNCFLTCLDLSANKIGGKGVRAIARMLLQNVTLEELNLMNNKLIDKDVSLLCGTLKENFHLKVLNLGGNNLGEQAGGMLGATLSANNVLEELDVSWNRILGKGAIALAKGVKESWSLKVLKLAWNGFGDIGAQVLRKVLEENETLIHLDITNASIGLDGAGHIGKGLKVNKTLKILKVGRNPFLSAGALILLKAALKNTDSALEEMRFENIAFDRDCESALGSLLKRKPNFSCTWDIMIEGGRVRAMDEHEATPLDKFIHFVRTKGLRMVDLYRRLTRTDSLREGDFAKGMKSMDIQMGERELRELFRFLDENDDKELQFSEFTRILNKRIKERDAQKTQKKNEKGQKS
ncbi:leucine-rich repeat-containing protein 74B [Nematostella vectensis]|uniref:leucine-rich repeat-containing protein 74B n=1 Tax=Nematostella vectensis TaxID=45351 RepID=UPI0020778F62|nr:leucine-rich repeat-containing protein 74B [Nematostella vectensis]